MTQQWGLLNAINHVKKNQLISLNRTKIAVLISLFQMLEPIIESWLGHMQWNCCVQHQKWNDAI